MNAEILDVVLSFRQVLSSSSHGEGYQVEIISGPLSGWGGPFVPAGLDDAQITAIRQLYRQHIEQRKGPVKVMDERKLEPLRAVGSQLFHILPESVQDYLHQAQALAQEDGKGLGIVLAFDANAQPLLNLPWELLFSPQGRYFFALRGGGITRQLRLPMGRKPGAVPHAGKILGLWAEPGNGDSLAIRRQYAPSPDQGAGFAWLVGADSQGKLTRALEQGQYDSLHIVAHGRLGSGWDDFMVALEDKGGKVKWTSPDQLAILLSGYPSLRFIYLDICAGAESSANGDESGDLGLEHFYGSLATRLLGCGVAALVAMQDEVAQKAAGLAAQTFYAQRALGASLSGAMTQARRAVRLQFDDPIDWGIPVLYSQRKPREQRGLAVRAADMLLDNILELVRPGLWLLLAVVLLVDRLSRALAELTPGAAEDWQALAISIALSVLLTILGAWGMHSGYRRLNESYTLGRRGWLNVLLDKYSGASIWVCSWWFLVWAMWLLLVLSGMDAGLGVAGRKGLWALSLFGIYAASFVGARQSIRQSQLFLRAGGLGKVARRWFLFLLAPFLPVMMAWILNAAWAFLTSTVAGFYALLVFVLIVAALVRGIREPGSGP